MMSMLHPTQIWECRQVYLTLWRQEDNQNVTTLSGLLRHKSLVFGAIYLILVFGIQHFMKERRAFHLRTPLMLWSFSLTLFSVFAASRVWKQMAFLLLNKGFKQSVCSRSVYVHPATKLWLHLFAVSKYVELGDTVFIVLRKKKLIFLHWYHHLIAAVVAWYSYKDMVAGVGWVAALNLSVHGLTYSYYTVTATGIRVPKSIALIITTSQMVQMTGFVIMNIFIFFWKDDKVCYTTWPLLLTTSCAYTTLLILFGNFFFKTYLRGTWKSKGE
ncbi:elongation of very long chain fatty acids protein 3 [Neopelma chrysocephalum]|uniref:elongation of very long chain fatty acids protein 3 n=1 Tax=Neopelma chrysocephalum TaxID=114329 RepID=UPI000FCD3F2E|nr:elongation of very long chain fatty acids protein 3 [Neopelma chrysocephalum]